VVVVVVVKQPGSVCFAGHWMVRRWQFCRYFWQMVLAWQTLC
jgi:hypothetical protein